MDEQKDPILKVQELSAIFQNENGGLHTLNEVTFSIASQAFVCLLGPSGSGKSTLLRIMAGLLPTTHGSVFYKGQLVNGPSRGLGVVFQKANLMPWRTVFENILLPLELSGLEASSARKQAQAMIELVGLEGFEQSLPRDLSGGMAQRVTMARALIYDPDVLLMDEPFGALDAMTRERMGLELLRIWQARKKTIFMVTHSISEALFLSDRVLVMSPRPGQLRLDLPVLFDRPRQEDIRYTPEFGELAHQIRSAIGDA